MRSMLETFINALLSAQAESVCGAEYGARSPERSNRRNGTGTATWIPGSGRWMWRCRSFGKGRSSRTGCCGAGGGGGADLGGDLLPARGLHSAGGQAGPVPRHHRPKQVPGSEMAKDLDQQVEAFRTRPLGDGPYTFVAR